MVEENWVDLEATELRYRDRTWELTGDVDVRASGEVLAVEARQTDDVRRGDATLYFGLQEGTHSLNPGNLGDHFDRLERVGDDHHLVVKNDGRTYRYELQRLSE